MHNFFKNMLSEPSYREVLAFPATSISLLCCIYTFSKKILKYYKESCNNIHMNTVKYKKDKKVWKKVERFIYLLKNIKTWY